MEALVHAIEVNDRHGAGILIRRLFGDGSNFVLFRSRTLYEGQNFFGEREVNLSDHFATRIELRARLTDESSKVRRILCVPYYPEDFRHAVMLREITGAPMATFLMDDQNIFSREVGDAAVAELLDRSDVIFAISPQMASAYAAKYGRRVGWLPPVVLERRPAREGATNIERQAALIGNVWSGNQLDELRRVIRGSGWQVQWFGRGPEASWLNCRPEELAADGIFVRGFLDDDALALELRQFPFAIVPTGTLDESDEKRSFTALSLPSRVIYVLTQAGIPLLVLGSPQSAAAVFVREMGVGISVSYSETDFVKAAAALTLEDFSMAVNRAAEAMRLPEAGEWIWRSLALGQPADDRFEILRSGELADVSPSVAPVKSVVRRESRLTQLRRRLGFASADDSAWLRISRRSHLPWIRKMTGLRATGPHTFEVSDYQRALVIAVVRRTVTPGGLVRVLSDGDAPSLRPLTARYRVEAVSWRSTEIPTEGAEMVVSFNQAFGAQVSVAWLDRFAMAGARQMHCWTAYQQPGHFRVGDAAWRLLDELADSSLVADSLTDDEDFLWMSERAMTEFWPGGDVSAGRPFSLNLSWRSAR